MAHEESIRDMASAEEVLFTLSAKNILAWSTETWQCFLRLSMCPEQDDFRSICVAQCLPPPARPLPPLFFLPEAPPPTPATELPPSSGPPAGSPLPMPPPPPHLPRSARRGSPPLAPPPRGASPQPPSSGSSGSASPTPFSEPPAAPPAALPAAHLPTADSHGGTRTPEHGEILIVAPMSPSSSPSSGSGTQGMPAISPPASLPVSLAAPPARTPLASGAAPGASAEQSAATGMCLELRALPMLSMSLPQPLSPATPGATTPSGSGSVSGSGGSGGGATQSGDSYLSSGSPVTAPAPGASVQATTPTSPLPASPTGDRAESAKPSPTSPATCSTSPTPSPAAAESLSSSSPQAALPISPTPPSTDTTAPGTLAIPDGFAPAAPASPVVSLPATSAGVLAPDSPSPAIESPASGIGSPKAEPPPAQPPPPTSAVAAALRREKRRARAPAAGRTEIARAHSLPQEAPANSLADGEGSVDDDEFMAGIDDEPGTGDDYYAPAMTTAPREALEYLLNTHDLSMMPVLKRSLRAYCLFATNRNVVITYTLHGQPRFMYRAPEMLGSVAVSPGATLLAAGALSQPTVYLWDIQSTVLLRAVTLDAPAIACRAPAIPCVLRPVFVSPRETPRADGRILDEGQRAERRTHRQRLQQLQRQADALAPGHPAWAVAVSTSHRVFLLDTQGKILSSISPAPASNSPRASPSPPATPPPPPPPLTTALAWSPVRHTLYAGGADGRVRSCSVCTRLSLSLALREGRGRGGKVSEVEATARGSSFELASEEGQNLHSTVFTGLYAGHLSPTPRPVTASATADAAARAATTPAAPAPAPAITSLLAAQGLLYTAAEDRTIRIWRA